jgi:hypothetical protein
MNCIELAVDTHKYLNDGHSFSHLDSNSFLLKLIMLLHSLKNVLNILIVINVWHCTNIIYVILQLRKKTVKEQKAEKRKTKIKKHVKKRKEKLQHKRK